MVVLHTDERLVLHAPAKLNLFLEVLGRRPDGYHEVDTAMLAIGLHDTLELAPAADAAPGTTAFRCDAPGLGGPDNLALRAVALVRRDTGRAEPLRLTLVKRIPAEAGLAGGSADAAATLIGLNHWWNLGWDGAACAARGAELGSDVPFFCHLDAAPAAWCQGRGERVRPQPVARPLHAVVLKPPVGLATRAVFARLQPPAAPRPSQPLRDALAAGDAAGVAAGLFNRLEEPAAALQPAVPAALAALRAAGALGAALTGSGTACFGICRDAPHAQAVAAAVAAELPHRPLLRGGAVFAVRSG